MKFDELKQAGFVVHHYCGGCRAPVGYEIHPELAVACFNSGCECGVYTPNYRAITHEELAAIILAEDQPKGGDA